MRRVVLIGLDGVPFKLVKDLAYQEVMPNIKEIIKEGFFKDIFSTLPEISSVAWSSIITGANPAQHGIFGFNEIDLNYNLWFPNFRNLKKEPFWLKKNKKSIIINVPSTYPVRRMRGVHISGFVSIDFEKSVYPVSLIPKLKELEYRLDVDSQKAHHSIELFLEDLEKTLEARINTYRFLWNYIEWDIFMLVFTETDRLLHFLWTSYEDKDNYYQFFLDCFNKIDMVIGEIKRKINKDDILLIFSDHGFEKLKKDIFVNRILEENGFLKFSSEREWRNISEYSSAFALDPARIYINSNDKYPNSKISPNQKKRIIEELKSLFFSLEFEGEKIIREIYQKEQIYKGPYLECAPDLVLLPHSGFNLRATLSAEKAISDSIFKGKHTYSDAFLVGEKEIESLSCVSDVIDLGRIINSFLN
jgi:predicted AlkP superfamily phosphohydrolase/phosphomutase